MSASNYKVGRGSTIGVVEDAAPTTKVLTAAAAAKGATSITLTAAATETADLQNGDLLAFDTNLVAKVTADVQVTDAGVAVSVKRLGAALAGSETTPFKDYPVLGGVKQLNFNSNRGEIDVGTLENWENKSYIPDLIDGTVDLGDLQIIAGDPAQDLVRKYHYTNEEDCLYWQLVIRNGMIIRFPGFTTGNLPINTQNEGSVVNGAMNIRIAGDVEYINVFD